ncbi:MAG TPA: agmatinase [Methanothermobacter sp.]|nr:predicted arginase/agmatinase/formimionoglutamate hydrolase [Methanothermobacter sp. MT-2]HHW05322.1 agmatinase [Methanothermobacter sp.]HOK72934.1 agmatinase [Methanothermobacter sp.]HOL68980.1 agmatinase [Methanothermobacter sp.]HPQ04883.1 agmatinase [Methanothermobacter sp.]
MLLYLEDSSKFAFSRREPLKEFLSSQKWEGDVFGVIGVPFDSTATYMPGARFGPSAIREASYNFERYNLTFNKELEIPNFDLGDIEVTPGNFKETSKRIVDTLNELTPHIKPLILGGEHTITYPIIKALKHTNPIIIHFDAHMDLRDYYNGRFSHATVMRRVYELEPQNMIMIGVRSASKEETRFAREHNIEYYTPQMIRENAEELTSRLKSIKKPIYLTIDIDVLDPSYAPMVGNPSPCGLTPFQMEKLIKIIAEKELVGVDIVEVASSSKGDQTSINAAKILHDLLSLKS